MATWFSSKDGKEIKLGSEIRIKGGHYGNMPNGTRAKISKIDSDGISVTTITGNPGEKHWIPFCGCYGDLENIVDFL